MDEGLEAAALSFRFILAFVFLTAAVPKLSGRREFERAVANYALLPPGVVRPVAAWLPRLELAGAVALLVGIVVVPIAIALCVLLVAFAFAVAINLLRGRLFDCGCFSSVAPRRIGWPLVGADLGLAGMAATVALADPGLLAVTTTDSGSSLSSTEGLALLTLAGALVLGYLLVSSWLSLRSPMRTFREGAGA
jgi:uncharacterized membrane protein YphA (DoxX/SURF4 family)